MLASSKISFSKMMASGFFAGLLVITSIRPARSSNGVENINKAALTAYCEEADKDRQPLTDGLISYKTVARMASNRAMIEHPDVYHDPNGWLARIVDLLDKYGDEPTSELCQEEPQS